MSYEEGDVQFPVKKEVEIIDQIAFVSLILIQLHAQSPVQPRDNYSEKVKVQRGGGDTVQN